MLMGIISKARGFYRAVTSRNKPTPTKSLTTPTKTTAQQTAQKNLYSKLGITSPTSNLTSVKTSTVARAGAGGTSSGGGGGGTSQPQSTMLTQTPNALLVYNKTSQQTIQQKPIVYGGGTGSVIIAGGYEPITRKEEKTSALSLGGAFMESGRALFNVGKIGQTQSFVEYEKDIFSPFSSWYGGVAERGITTPVITTFGKGGLKQTGGWVSFGDLSISEIASQQRKIAGEPSEFINLPIDVAADKISKQEASVYGGQAQEEFNKLIAPQQKRFQERIYSGEDYATVTSEFNKLQTIYSEEISKKYGDIAQKSFETKFGEFTKQRGVSEKVISQIQRGEDFGGQIQLASELVGITAASFTPIGAAAVSGYFLGKGTADITGGFTMKGPIFSEERMIKLGAGVFEAGLGSWGAKSLLGEQRIMMKNSAGKEVSVPSNMLERQYQKELFADLSKQKMLLTGEKAVQVEGGVFQKFKGGKFGEGIKQEVEFGVVGYPAGEGRVNLILGGTEKTTFRTLFGEEISFPKQAFKVTTPYGASITKELPFTRMFEGWDLTSGEGVGVSGISRLKIGKKWQEYSSFLGVSRETPTETLLFGGNIKGRTWGTFEGEVVSPFGQYYKVNKKYVKSVRGDIKTVGIVPKEIETAGMKDIIIQKGVKEKIGADIFTKLDKTVAPETMKGLMRPSGRGAVILESPETLTALEKSLIKPVSAGAVGLSSELDLKFLPRYVGGGGGFTGFYAGTGKYELTGFEGGFKTQVGGVNIIRDFTGEIGSGLKTQFDFPAVFKERQKPLQTNLTKVSSGQQYQPRFTFGAGVMSLGQGENMKSGQMQQQKLLQPPKLKTPNNPLLPEMTFEPFKPFEPPPTFFPIIPRLNFDFGIGTRRTKGKEQRKKYTPDYPSLVLGRKGKAPKSTMTGLEIRPIPKKFRWEFGRIKL